MPTAITFADVVRALRAYGDELDRSDGIDRVVDALGQPGFEHVVGIYNDKYGAALAIQTAEDTRDFLGWAPW